MHVVAFRGGRLDRSPALRNLLAFAFFDAAASTSDANRLGDEYPGLLARRRAVLTECINRWGGAVVDSVGDELFCTFNSVTEAARASLELQAKALGGSDSAIPLLRIALHWAKAEWHHEVGYSSFEVHRAHRLVEAADAGQILLTAAAAAELGDLGGPRAVDRGSYWLRGLTASEQLFQLCSPGEAGGLLRARPAGGAPLPIRAVELVGRQAAYEQVSALVAEHRLVTIVGPGGVGKTRLVVELVAANALQPRAVFTDLSELRDATREGVAGELLAQLGVSHNPDVPATDAMIDLVGGQSMTLVVDNFEHLLDAGGLLADLLAGAPGLHLLVTSRASLGLVGERVFELRPLAVRPAGTAARGPRTADPPALSDAARLYRAHLAAAGSLEAASNDPQLHERLVARLDGLPLAIELAASRAANLGSAEVLAALDRSLAVLSSPAPNRPTRHRSLEVVLAWSVDLLGPRERRLFIELAALPAGATSATLAEVSGLDPVDLLDALGELVRFHLVHRLPGRAGDRFAMLGLIRAFGEVLLGVEGQPAMVRQRATVAYRGWAQRVGVGLTGTEQFELVGDIDDELDNLRAIMAWAPQARELVPPSADILAALTTYFWHRNTLEALTWHRALLRVGGLGRIEPLLAVRAALLASYLGEPDTNALAQLAVDRCRAEGRRGGVLLEGLLIVAATELAAGERGSACEKATEALELAERFDGVYLGIALTNSGDIFLGAGEDERAAELFERAVALFGRADESWMRAAPIGRLGELAMRAGRPVDARGFLTDAVRMWQRAGTRRAMPRALSALGRVAHIEGDLDGARSLIREGLEHVEAVESWGELSWPVLSAGLVALDQHRPDAAVDLFESARQIGRRLNQPVDICFERELRGAFDAAHAGDPSASDRWQGHSPVRLDRAVRMAEAALA